MGKDKVQVAVYDDDYKIRSIEKYEISDRGNKIRIRPQTGTEHWMPKLGDAGKLYFPSWRKYFLFGPRTYKELYIVKNNGKECVNFQTEKASGPEPEQMEQAVGATLLNRLGQLEIDIPVWMQGIILITFFLVLWSLHIQGAF